MRLSDDAISEFRELCREACGADVSASEAAQRAWEVLDFFWILSVGGERARDADFDRVPPQPLP